MRKTILVTEGAGFKSAGRLGTLRSCQWRSSDINFVIQPDYERQI